jgi:chloramphenicol 3-O-phosphotransferase
MVALEFYANGASLVHGCDIYAEGIATANHVFVDRRNVEAKFEVVDLSAGAISLQAFGNQRYDIIVVLATIHKLRRVMQREMLYDLIRELGERTIKYLGWRATSEKFQENEEEMAMMDGALAEAGLRRVHTSYISQELGVAAIWMRK